MEALAVEDVRFVHNEDNDARACFIADQLLVAAAEEALAKGLPVTFPPPPVKSAISSFLLSTSLPVSAPKPHSFPNSITFSTLPMPKPTLPFSARAALFSALHYSSPRN